MLRKVMTLAVVSLIMCGFLVLAFAFAQSMARFNDSTLVKLGDSIRFGAYIINKIGERSYQILQDGAGPGGPDMYLVRGTERALMIDLGNNLIDGMPGRGESAPLPPRNTAAEELRSIAYGLAGNRPLEIAVTHAHPDHIGMTNAFVKRNVNIWMAEGEISGGGAQRPFKIDAAAYTLFAPGEKTFDLGGGHIVDTFLIRGHSNGGTVYILKKDLLIFSGDALGSGLGQSFSAEGVKKVAEDSKNFVDYIKNKFSPYERYALRVYPGHSLQMVYGGYLSEAADKIDVGYLDWRFIQNMASCANGILKGRWLVEDSGLRYVARPGQGLRGGVMVFGIGAIAIPLEAAYEAAGIKMSK